MMVLMNSCRVIRVVVMKEWRLEKESNDDLVSVSDVASTAELRRRMKDASGLSHLFSIRLLMRMRDL